jgi:hypothetical protein
MEMVTGQIGRCHWQWLQGAIEGAGWRRYIDHMFTVGDKLQQGDVILDLWHDTGRPGAAERHLFADQFMKHPGVHLVRAHAFVTNSTVTRGMLTAINWMIERPFEEKVFARPDDAVGWLAGIDPRVDASALLESVRQAVSGYAAFRW